MRPECSGPLWTLYVVARFEDGVGESFSPEIVSCGWQRRYRGVDELMLTVTVLSMHGYWLDWHTEMSRSASLSKISPVAFPMRG